MKRQQLIITLDGNAIDVELPEDLNGLELMGLLEYTKGLITERFNEFLDGGDGDDHV